MNTTTPDRRFAPRHCTRDQGGFALLGAILIAAIVIALALGIGQRSSFAIAGTARALEAAAAGPIFAALESAAGAVLREDAAQGQVDSADETWAGTPLTVEEPFATGEGELRDRQGLFNLNNLVSDPAWAPAAGGAAGDGPAGSANTGDLSALPEVMPATAAVGAQTVTAGGDRRSAAAPGPTADNPAAAGAGGGPDVLVPRDTVIVPVGAYHDPRPRGSERGAVSVGAGQGAGSAGTAAETVTTDGAALDSPSAAGSAGRSTDPAAATQALAGLPVLADSGGDVVPARGTGTPRQLAAHEIALARFSLLLTALDIDAEIIPAILDWIDPDTDARYPGGAEDDYYMALDEPYRVANRPFTDVTELRLVRGVTAELYAKLAPFVIALPVVTTINVNTAPLEVLMSLGPGIDRGTAEILVSARDAHPFQTVDAFTGFPLLLGRPVLGGGLSTQSYWFALVMHARAGDSVLSARTVLARNGSDRIDIVARSRGYFDE